jgi:hypothetical protein
LSTLEHYLDTHRRYAREARRQKFMLGNQGRANHYALRALVALNCVYVELDSQVKRARPQPTVGSDTPRGRARIS